MTSIKPATELDFDELKQQIIDFIKNDQTFSDYNFEGSALNAIADMLAYNTHTNAFYANMVHNESFIDTAQKRSSVVSRAKEMGYVPRSAVCSTAMIDLTLSRPISTNLMPLILERGSSISFRSINSSGNSYSFVTTSDVSAVRIVNGTTESYSYPSLKIVSGTPVRNSITVSPSNNQGDTFIITIPNKNVDMSTLSVMVRESSSQITGDIWTKADNSYVASPTEKIYYTQESYDGHFQIYFGENIVGKKVENGYVVELFYVVSSATDEADGCRDFAMENLFVGSFSDLNAEIVTRQVSFGGADKETIKSIKHNAILSNTAKQRSVSVNDYELVLKNKFNYIKSVSVWGGEDNYPPVYGKVFISIQPVSGLTISDAMKSVEILPELKKYNMVTITPELVDPEYTFVDFSTLLKFNPRRSTLSVALASSLVKNTISEYISDISVYNTNYIDSVLISKLANADSGFVSVQISKKIGFNVAPITRILTNFKKNINNIIKHDSISSTKFVELVDGVEHVVSIKEIPGSEYNTQNGNGESNRIVRLGTYTQLGTLVSDIGYANTTIGSFDILIAVYKYLTSSRFISIRMETADRDIEVKRNQIIALAPNVLDLDIGLSENNIVNIELENG
jgi:hypothetical protein